MKTVYCGISGMVTANGKFDVIPTEEQKKRFIEDMKKNCPDSEIIYCDKEPLICIVPESTIIIPRKNEV